VESPAPIDAKVRRAMEAIHQALETATIERAKTLDELARTLPEFSKRTLEEAVQRLLADGRLRRSGDGSESPYRYYERASGGG